MFQKIDSREFSSRFLWQLWLLTVLVMGFALYSAKFAPPAKPSGATMNRVVLYPWALAGAHTINNGLLAFSGKPPEAPNGKDQVRVLAGFLAVSVLCPTVYFLRWRRRKLASASIAEPEPWSLVRVFFGMCSVLTLLVTVALPPIAIRAEMVQHSLRDAQAVQSNRDAIINDINFISINVAQFYILPTELGGGGRSLEVYVLPQEMTKTENGSYVATVEGRKVGIRATSTSFPDCWVEMKIDSSGRMNEWTYGGKFR